MKGKVEGSGRFHSTPEECDHFCLFFSFPICSAYLPGSLQTQKKRLILPEDYVYPPL